MEIFWPDDAEIGRWPLGGNDWHIVNGLLFCKQSKNPYHTIGYGRTAVPWREAVADPEGCTSQLWAQWMQSRAIELGFTEPPRPKGELVSEMRATILAVSQCQNIEAIREAVK